MMDNKMFGFKTKRQYHDNLKAQLKNEQASFLPHWRDCGDFVNPRRQRYITSDRNMGDKRNHKILNGHASMALRTLKAGMMSGITSPARQWFKLTTSDPDMAEFGRVKEWLDIVSRRMTNMLLKSNYYAGLPNIYGDMGTFATSAMLLDEDFETGLHTYTFPIGSYMIANDEKYKVKVFFREFSMTVRQLISKFGEIKNGEVVSWDNFSGHVKSQYEQGNLEAWVDVCHVINKNLIYNPNSPLSKHKEYSSCYYEAGTGSGSGSKGYDAGKDVYLQEMGYEYFPVIVPRWEVTGEDVYGTDCPTMTVLGDIKMLQQGEKLSLQGLEKMVNPAMIAPVSLKTSKASTVPGEITWVKDEDAAKTFRIAQPIDFHINMAEEKNRELERRISRGYYEDLFLMMAQTDRTEITAREVDERKEEKLLALGQVLGQFNQDGADPTIDIAFKIMERQGMLPEAPEELQGMPLKIEYLSILSQAQKLIGVANVERFMGTMVNMIPVSPKIGHKINWQQAVDIYGDQLSVPAGLVRTDDEADELENQANKAMAMQQGSETMRNVTGSVNDLANAPMDGENALTKLLKPGASPQ